MCFIFKSGPYFVGKFQEVMWVKNLVSNPEKRSPENFWVYFSASVGLNLDNEIKKGDRKFI